MKFFNPILTVCVWSIISITVFGRATDPVMVIYQSTDAIFPNPERGFYNYTEARHNSSPLSRTLLQTARNNNRSLIIRNYTISEFRDKDLSEGFLDLVRQDFQILREEGVKCVLRFRYSVRIGEADAPLAIIERHLDQLQPVFEENYDVIAVMEAGFIGAWGEWHSSTNNLATTSGRRAVLTKILSVLPGERMVQVRTPWYKMAIFSTSNPVTVEMAYDGSDISRTGHHNDGFLADATDLGTYTNPVWEKNYLSQDTRFTPMGGETAQIREGEYYKCPNALNEMERMHWSYINRDYYTGTIGSWITDGCFDEVQRRLGYRFELIQGRYDGSVERNSVFHMEIKLTNRGWAAPYNRRGLEILLRHTEDGTVYYTELWDDPRFWLADDTVHINASIGVPSDIHPGSYELLLHLPDPSERLYGRPEFSIRLGNENVWEPSTGYNKLLHTLDIDETVSQEGTGGDLLFRLFGTPSHAPDINNSTPRTMHLYGSFPNPFNPVTTIRFELFRREHVRISVYNILGQEIGVPINDELNPGMYDIPFSGDALPSGTYLYQITGSSEIETRSMILMK
jgi:hypothetical protein